MAYTPINAQAFTAAYAGVIAGMGVSGWIVDPNENDYANIAAIAGAFAQAFDIAWADAADLTAFEYQTIATVCQQEFAGRGPGPETQASYQLAATWAIPANACVALITAGDNYLSGQSITPTAPCFCPAGGAPVYQAADTISDLLLVGYAASEPDVTLSGAWNLVKVSQGDEVLGIVRVLVEGAATSDVLEIQNDPASSSSIQIRQGPGGSDILITSILGGDVGKLVFDGTNWLPWGLVNAAT